MRSMQKSMFHKYLLDLNKSNEGIWRPSNFLLLPDIIELQDKKLSPTEWPRSNFGAFAQIGWDGPEITSASRNALCTSPIRTRDLMVGQGFFYLGRCPALPITRSDGNLPGKQKAPKRKTFSICPMSLWQHVIITASRKKAFPYPTIHCFKTSCSQ